MRSRPSLRWSLLAAIAAHVALGWSMRAGHAGRAASLEPTPELEIMVEREAPPIEAPVPVDPSEPAPADPRTRAAAARAETRAATDRPHTDESAATPVAEAAPGDGTWTFSPTVTGPGGGDAGAPGGLSPRALAAATRAGVGKTLADEAREEDARPPRPVFSSHDLSLGLGPGGQFVTTTREKVRTSLAPEEGRALLEFRTDLAGALVSVRVLNASSDPGAWAQVAAELQSDAGHYHAERVPAGGKGVSVVLEVVSALKTPSGRSANDSALKKAWGAIQDPLDTVMDSKLPVRRMVAVHVVDAQVL